MIACSDHLIAGPLVYAITFLFFPKGPPPPSLEQWLLEWGKGSGLSSGVSLSPRQPRSADRAQKRETPFLPRFQPWRPLSFLPDLPSLPVPRAFALVAAFAWSLFSPDLHMASSFSALRSHQSSGVTH